MMQRTLESRAFIVGHSRDGHRERFCFTRIHFPDQQIFLHVIADARPASFPELQIPLLRAPVHHALHGLLDRAFGPLHLHPESAPDRLAGPPSRTIPTPASETTCFWSSAKCTTHASRCPPETPYWLTIPERGLFTGIAILGAIGSGK